VTFTLLVQRATISPPCHGLHFESVLQQRAVDRHRFDGLFSRTTWESRCQKDQTIMDFDEARDDGVAVALAGPYADHLHLAPDSELSVVSLVENVGQLSQKIWAPLRIVPSPDRSPIPP